MNQFWMKTGSGAGATVVIFNGFLQWWLTMTLFDNARTESAFFGQIASARFRDIVREFLRRDDRSCHPWFTSSIEELRPFFGILTRKSHTTVLSYSGLPLLQRKTSRTTLLRMDSARDGRAGKAKCRHRNGSALNFAALWMPRRTVFPLRKSACIPSVFDALADVANLQDVQYVSARGRCASNNKACSEPLRGGHPLWIDWLTAEPLMELFGGFPRWRGSTMLPLSVFLSFIFYSGCGFSLLFYTFFFSPLSNRAFIRNTRGNRPFVFSFRSQTWTKG